MRLTGQSDRSRSYKPKFAVLTRDYLALGTFIGRARRDPRVEAFYLSSYIDYAPSAFKSSSETKAPRGALASGGALGALRPQPMPARSWLFGRGPDV